MKYNVKILTLLLISVISIFATFVLLLNSFTDWEVKNKNADKDGISWTTFKWIDREINGKYVEKAYMFIPCKVDGIPNDVTFQFDLGADLTCIYEKNYSSFYRQNPKLAENIKNVKFRNKKYFENINIHFGDYTATTKSSLVLADYGTFNEDFTPKDTIHLGSIGADMFKNKVLIIDYLVSGLPFAKKYPNCFLRLH